MKKLILFFLLFFNPTNSYATIKNISIDLSYSGSAITYNLYMNSIKVGTILGTLTTATLSIDIDLTKDNIFNLTAIDNKGIESPQSAPYIVHYIGYVPPVIIPPVIPPTPPPVVPDPIIPPIPSPVIENVLPVFTLETKSGVKKLVSYTWEYTGSSNISGFKLYHNGKIIKITLATDRTSSMIIELSSTQNNYLYLTAYDSISETLPSNFFKLDIAILPLNPQNIRIIQ